MHTDERANQDNEIMCSELVISSILEAVQDTQDTKNPRDRELFKLQQLIEQCYYKDFPKYPSPYDLIELIINLGKTPLRYCKEAENLDRNSWENNFKESLKKLKVLETTNKAASRNKTFIRYQKEAKSISLAWEAAERLGESAILSIYATKTIIRPNHFNP